MTDRSCNRVTAIIRFFDRSLLDRKGSDNDAPMSGREPVITLWRPVGPQELKLIEASGMREFPPRLPDQPIFYPLLSEAYAMQIARDWNALAPTRASPI
jgi:hypothetical protein